MEVLVLAHRFPGALPFIILSCLSVSFSVASYLWLVPSPRWLTLSGRQSEASAIWDILGVSHAEREKVENRRGNEIAVLEAHGPMGSLNQPAIDSGLPIGREAKKHSFFDVFSADVRARTGLAAFMMAMQQLNGIDGVLYVSLRLYTKSCTQKSLTFRQYAPLLFEQAGTHICGCLVVCLWCFCNRHLFCNNPSSVLGG